MAFELFMANILSRQLQSLVILLWCLADVAGGIKFMNVYCLSWSSLFTAKLQISSEFPRLIIDFQFYSSLEI